MAVATRAPHPAELEAFREQLARLGVTGREAEPHLRAADVARHTLLLSAGDSPDRSGVVLAGVVREYYLLDDGTERTRGFALPGDSFGSLSDALAKRPSRVFVRAESDARVLFLHWPVIERLARGSLEWERLKYALVERLYLRKSTREFELLGLDALGRYESLLEQHPRLEREVAQQLIASYLGITPVHLSRLRKLRGSAPAKRGRRRAQR